MIRKFLSTPESVAEVVKSQRQVFGLSQAQLAQKAAVGRRFIVDLEAGHPRAELGKVLDVLEALDVYALALPAVARNDDVDNVDLQAQVNRFA